MSRVRATPSIATLAAGLAAGMRLDAAATLANAAAGIVVAKVGTAVAYADELVHALRHEDLAAEERRSSRSPRRST